jgi:hypothetical protein
MDVALVVAVSPPAPAAVGTLLGVEFVQPFLNQAGQIGFNSAFSMPSDCRALKVRTLGRKAADRLLSTFIFIVRQIG